MRIINRTLSLFAALLMLGGSSALAADEPFAASITVYAPVVITETAPMSFGIVTASGSTQVVVVDPADAGAAGFDITGEGSMAITATVVETSLALVNGATTITVDSFTYGGSLSGTGTATFSNQGAVAGAKVGASASIPANPDAGSYAGTLTFRVVYQ